MEIAGLLVAALFAILAFDAYRSNRRMDLSWARAKSEYDRMIQRLTRSPYDDLRGVRMAGPMNWMTSTACVVSTMSYWPVMTARSSFEVGPGMPPIPLGGYGYTHQVYSGLEAK